MADLSGVLGRVPGLAGYLGARQIQQQEGAQELAQAQNLMGILSAAQQQQQRNAALQREEAFRGALGALGPSPTQEQLAQVSARFGTPDAIMRTQQGSLDRAAQRDNAATMAAAAREERKAALQERLTDAAISREERANLQRELAQMQIQGRQDMMQLAASLRPPRQEPAPIATDQGLFVRGPNGLQPLMDPNKPGQQLKPAGAVQKRDPMAQAAYNAGLRDIQRDEKDLASVSQLENALKRWSELNAETSTGRVVGLRPAVAQPQLQELQQLQSYLAVNNFKPGQGQISNFERQLIKGAGPNVMNDPETNQRIVDIQLGAVQNARDRAAFREQYLEANGKLLGADKAWNEYIEKNPRYTKGADGAIIPNKNRKAWTDHFTSQRPADPAGGARSVIDEADAILRGNNNGGS